MALLVVFTDERGLEAVGSFDERYLLKRPVFVDGNHVRCLGFMIGVVIEVGLIAVGEGGKVKTVAFPTNTVEQVDPVLAV